MHSSARARIKKKKKGTALLLGALFLDAPVMDIVS